MNGLPDKVAPSVPLGSSTEMSSEWSTSMMSLVVVPVRACYVMLDVLEWDRTRRGPRGRGGAGHARERGHAACRPAAPGKLGTPSRLDAALARSSVSRLASPPTHTHARLRDSALHTVTFPPRLSRTATPTATPSPRLASSTTATRPWTCSRTQGSVAGWGAGWRRRPRKRAPRQRSTAGLHMERVSNPITQRELGKPKCLLCDHDPRDLM